MTNDNSTTASPTGTLAIREELVRPAAKFLADPKVASSPLAKKIAFLESKGLSAEEIEVALQRSRSQGNSASVKDTSAQVINVPPPVPPPTYPVGSLQYQGYLEPLSLGTRVRDLSVAVALVGSAGYSMYWLAKTYFADWISNKNQSENDKLLATVAELRDQLDRMHLEAEKRSATLSEVKSELEELHSILPKLVDERGLNSYSLADVQSELKSLKSLILNRRHLVPTAAATASSYPADTPESKLNQEDPLGILGIKPAIPSWQLEHKPKNSIKTTVDAEQDGQTAELEQSNEQQVEKDSVDESSIARNIVNMQEQLYSQSLRNGDTATDKPVASETADSLVDPAYED